VRQPTLLDRDAVAGLLNPRLALESARRAFTALAEGRVEMPQRLAVRVERHHGTHLSMPCYVDFGDGEVLCIKVATVFDGNRGRGVPTTLAFLALQSAETGELLALMDAEHLTAARTAAASALATDLLALPDSSSLALVGAGGQARAHLEAIVQVRPIQRVRVAARRLERAQAFAEEAQKRFGLSVEAVETATEAVRGAEVVCLATNSTEPTFSPDALAPGAHVNAVGAFRPDMCEMPPEAVGRATVFVDRVEAARAGAGDLIRAESAGHFRWEDIRGELGDLLLGRCPGRRSAEEITLFKSVGLAVQDAAAAAAAYEQVR
jgi:ornithine cyclodeaminase/alanine dehydrogenase-like protein (mu-crystallin family)